MTLSLLISDVRIKLVICLEGFYNYRRIISADGHLTPDKKEQLVS